jgi:hypothetical protein
VVPAQITGRIYSIEDMWVELEKRSLKLKSEQPLYINLRGDNNKNAECERNHQPELTFFYIFSSPPESQGKPHACPREKEKKRHMPCIHKSVLEVYDETGCVVLYVEAPKGEHHSCMKGHQQGYRYDSKPINKI